MPRSGTTSSSAEETDYLFIASTTPHSFLATPLAATFSLQAPPTAFKAIQLRGKSFQYLPAQRNPTFVIDKDIGTVAESNPQSVYGRVWNHLYGQSLSPSSVLSPGPVPFLTTTAALPTSVSIKALCSCHCSVAGLFAPRDTLWSLLLSCNRAPLNKL